MNTTSLLSRLRIAVSKQLDYEPDNKAAFHRAARAVLKQIASDLGLASGSFDIRSNMAGIAVSGEVTLHAEGVYIQFDKGLMGNKFMYRACKGRKDYCGMVNEWMSYETLCSDYETAIQRFKNSMESGLKALSIARANNQPIPK